MVVGGPCCARDGQSGSGSADTFLVSESAPVRSASPSANHWQAHPVASVAIRLLVLFLPVAAAVVIVAALGRATPAPQGAARVLWVGWLFATGTTVALVLERAARRVLPLAILLQLSLAFPDRAPSRFAMARTAGNVRRLRERIDEAKARGIDDDPATAAAQILELVAALSAHDRKTRGHSERVRAYADMLATELQLDDDDRDRLRWAALLHDIGKLHVPSRILNKPGKPDAAEWERLMAHPAEGAAIAAPLAPWLGRWASTIVQHHERFDGTGYPAGLAAEEISIGARVVAVADSFEVMTAARAYKKPMTVPAARRELARCAGTQFDPDMVRAFLNISIGRLWWTVGAASWVAVVPVLGWLERSGEQIAIAVKTAAVVGALGVAGGVQTAGALSAPPPPTAPRVAGSSAPTSPAVPRFSPGPSSASETDRSDHSGDGSAGASGGSSSTEAPSGGSGSSSPTPDPSPTGGGTGGPVDVVTSVVDGATDTVDQTTGGIASPVTGVVDQTVKDAGDTQDPTIGHLGL
jgi:putative nucleotidyltransferase with HDIG domain